jgi:hypothetical protein
MAHLFFMLVAVVVHQMQPQEQPEQAVTAAVEMDLLHQLLMHKTELRILAAAVVAVVLLTHTPQVAMVDQV